VDSLGTVAVLILALLVSTYLLAKYGQDKNDQRIAKRIYSRHSSDYGKLELQVTQLHDELKLRDGQIKALNRRLDALEKKA